MHLLTLILAFAGLARAQNPTTIVHTLPCIGSSCAALDVATPPSRSNTYTTPTCPPGVMSCMDWGGTRTNIGRNVKNHVATTTRNDLLNPTGPCPSNGIGLYCSHPHPTTTTTQDPLACRPGTCGPACRSSDCYVKLARATPERRQSMCGPGPGCTTSTTTKEPIFSILPIPPISSSAGDADGNKVHGVAVHSTFITIRI
ncbi:hypothetical protein BDW02DRAFT_605801 [Decorospora gaudefroyi]|uniref:Osmotin, thaumatin-like protein n=1 Tax=Decorospora gaudefroyi TaxID=184978 RepID=A0A6A5K5Q9_9PLEO|nr:hypothetical protein BDW02DRAFT_605801 [Decorospora gaudefroyi]